jgi:hypothetical protein
MSVICGQNIEATKTKCTYDDGICEIHSSPSIPTKYIPDSEHIALSRDYEPLNVDSQIRHTDLPSFDDLVNFRFIKADKKGGFTLNGCRLSISEIGWFGILGHYIGNEGHEEWFRETLKTAAKNVAKRFFDENENREGRLDKLKKILSSFGWGLPIIILGEKIICTFEMFPFCKYSPKYFVYVLSGYLEEVVKRKLDDVDFSLEVSALKITYT